MSKVLENIEHRTSNIERRMADSMAFSSMFDVRCSAFDVRIFNGLSEWTVGFNGFGGSR
jgi:hypothetical protein